MAEKSLSVEMTDPAPPPSWRTKKKKLSNTQILWNPFSLHKNILSHEELVVK